MVRFAERKLMLAINDRHRTATVREFGDPDAGVTILYFHRFGGGAMEFADAAEKLVAAGHHVCALEFFGHEASEWLEPEEYAPSADIACAASVIREYSDKPILVIGNGWGGHIALRALPAEPGNLIGVLLFDYVNSMQFDTDIVMPLEHAICKIAAPSAEQFHAELATLARPYGRFGRAIAQMSAKRMRMVGDLYSLPVHAAAYRPFLQDPRKRFSSGGHLIRLAVPVSIVNGRLAEFKNLLNPPRPDVRMPDTLTSYTSPRLGFLTWNSTQAIDRIIGFLAAARKDRPR